MFRRLDRPARGNPMLLRRLRGEFVSVIDEPAAPLERAFAALVVATMLATTAYLSLI